MNPRNYSRPVLYQKVRIHHSALVESLGVETSIQHIEAIYTKSSELYEMVKKILNDEQNNFIHQDYANRIFLRPTDEDSINEELHQEAPNIR